MKLLCFFLFLSGSVVFSQNLLARQLRVQERINVYRTASKNQSQSSLLKVLLPGQSVPVSKKSYGDFYKVKVVIQNKALVGFVRKKDCIKTYVETSREKAPIKKNLSHLEPKSFYKDSYGIGVSVGVTRFSQGGRDVETESGVTYNIGKTTSSSSVFSLFFDTPEQEDVAFKVYGFFRDTRFESEATTEGDPTADQYTTIHSFIGLGALLKYYSNSKLWWGGWLEYAKATEVKIESQNSSLSTNDVDLPNWITAGLGIGYDQQILNSLHVLLEGRVGLVVSTEPMQNVVEGLVSLAWKL